MPYWQLWWVKIEDILYWNEYRCFHSMNLLSCFKLVVMVQRLPFLVLYLPVCLGCKSPLSTVADLIVCKRHVSCLIPPAVLACESWLKVGFRPSIAHLFFCVYLLLQWFLYRIWSSLNLVESRLVSKFPIKIPEGISPPCSFSLHRDI